MHRGHQPQLFLVAPLGLQQLPGSAGAFPLPTGTLLLHGAPGTGGRTLHAGLRPCRFRAQPAGDSNPNGPGGGPLGGVRPLAPGGCAQARACAASGSRNRIGSAPGRRCRYAPPARAGQSAASWDSSPDFGSGYLGFRHWQGRSVPPVELSFCRGPVPNAGVQLSPVLSSGILTGHQVLNILAAGQKLLRFKSLTRFLLSY